MSEWASENPSSGLLRLLKDPRRYLVPPHQRDYSWSVDEIDRFFGDVADAMASGAPEYFLGLMVFKPEGTDRLVILDGQQRLATATLILAAIRTWLLSHGLQKDADQIQSEYIARRELGGKEQEPRLTLNRANNPVFAAHVVEESPSGDIAGALKKLRRHDPNRRLLEAILQCREAVAAMAHGAGSKDKAATALFELAHFLERNAKVVRLVVPNEANAYTVFETLNDRGLDLGALDLVKNYMFGKADGTASLPGLQDQWLQMMANLAGVRADEFLKSWWTSRNGRVQTAQLFQRFKEAARTAADVAKAATDMLRTSEQYAALEVADDPLWAGYSETARERVRALKLLGGSQTHPVLLAAMAKWDMPEMERLLRLLEVILVRYQLIGGGRTGRLEIACASLAVGIFEGKVKTTSEAYKALKDILPSDSDFRSKFEGAEEKSASKARFLLAALEVAARAGSGVAPLGRELMPAAALTVEHVLPKKPSPAWSAELAADVSFADECTHRLGNLCLLTAVNRRLGNLGFAEKKKIYAKSELVLTAEIAKYSDWSSPRVKERQKRLAKLAVSIWRFD